MDQESKLEVPPVVGSAQMDVAPEEDVSPGKNERAPPKRRSFRASTAPALAGADSKAMDKDPAQSEAVKETSRSLAASIRGSRASKTSLCLRLDDEVPIRSGASGSNAGTPRRCASTSVHSHAALSHRSSTVRRVSCEGCHSASNETLQLLEAGLRQFANRNANKHLQDVEIRENVKRDGDRFLPGTPSLTASAKCCMSEASSGAGAERLEMCAQASINMREDAQSENTSEPYDVSCPAILEEEEAHGSQQFLPQLLFAIVLGTLLGGTTVLFHQATTKLEKYHRLSAQSVCDWLWGDNVIERGTFGSGSMPPLGARFAFSCCMAIGTTLGAFSVSWASRKMAPECVGGGTIATKICLAVGSPVPLRVGCWRFALSMLYVGSGNALGIEAPTLHLSAAVASVLHSSSSMLASRIGSCFQVQSQMALFGEEGLPHAVVLGCAAGLSAAFGSPLAAISYAVEEYVDVRQTGIITTLVLMSSLCAALVRRAVEPLTGTGALSITGASSTSVEVGTHSAQAGDGVSTILPWILVATSIGLTLGTLSPFLMHVVLRIRRFCHTRRNITYEIFLGGMAGLLTGISSGALYVATACESSFYVGRLGATLDDACESVRVRTDSNLRLVQDMSILGFGKLFACAVCFATGGAGGLLMPSLIVGGLLGTCFGYAAAELDGALPDAGMVLGMAAFFSANMRLPLTAATVALEYATASSSFDTRFVCTIPLAAALGTWVSAWWDPLNIFERMMVQDGINPFTLNQQIQVMVHGSDSMSSMQSSSPHVSHRESLSSVTSLPLPLSHTRGSGNKEEYVECETSTRMVMAARRRSILAEFRIDAADQAAPRNTLTSALSSASPSFISSPDELLFSSRVRAGKQSRFTSAVPDHAPSVRSSRLRSPQLSSAKNADSNNSQHASARRNSITSPSSPGSCNHHRPNGIAEDSPGASDFSAPDPGHRPGHVGHVGVAGAISASSSFVSVSSNFQPPRAASCVFSGGLFGNRSKEMQRAGVVPNDGMETARRLSGGLPVQGSQPRLLGRGHVKQHKEFLT